MVAAQPLCSIQVDLAFVGLVPGRDALLVTMDEVLVAGSAFQVGHLLRLVQVDGRQRFFRCIENEYAVPPGELVGQDCRLAFLLSGTLDRPPDLWYAFFCRSRLTASRQDGRRAGQEE